MPRAASLAAVLALSALAGCATTPQATSLAPAASGSHALAPDQAYVQRVEQIARHRGIEVVWVNPPSRRPARANR